MIQASIIINDLKIPLYEFDHTFHTPTNLHNGFPSSRVQYQGFNFKIKAVQDNFLFERAVDGNIKNVIPKVEIVLEPAILGRGKTRTITLRHCYITNYRTVYVSTGSLPMQEVVSIAAGGVEDSNSTTKYHSKWFNYKPIDETVAPTVIEEENEPNFIGQYMEDLNGNRVTKEEIDINEEFFLFIKTEYSKGETISINLKDIGKDYEYNGVHMKNDIIRNISIKGDLTKVKLKAVEQQN